MPAEKTYPDIYPQQWNKIKDAAATYGIKIETANGKGGAFGVVMRWNWNYRVSATTGPTLKIEIMDAGILNPNEALNFVDGIIQQAIG